MAVNMDNHDDRRNKPYNNTLSTNTATWIQFATLFAMMLTSWISMTNDLTKLDVTQAHIKEDLQNLDTSFESHNTIHMKNLEDIKDQVRGLEISLTNMYAINNRRHRK